MQDSNIKIRKTVIYVLAMIVVWVFISASIILGVWSITSFMRNGIYKINIITSTISILLLVLSLAIIHREHKKDKATKAELEIKKAKAEIIEPENPELSYNLCEYCGGKINKGYSNCTYCNAPVRIRNKQI